MKTKYVLCEAGNQFIVQAETSKTVKYLKTWLPNCKSHRTTWTTDTHYAKRFSYDNGVKIVERLMSEI